MNPFEIGVQLLESQVFSRLIRITKSFIGEVEVTERGPTLPEEYLKFSFYVVNIAFCCMHKTLDLVDHPLWCR